MRNGWNIRFDTVVQNDLYQRWTSEIVKNVRYMKRKRKLIFICNLRALLKAGLCKIRDNII